MAERWPEKGWQVEISLCRAEYPEALWSLDFMQHGSEYRNVFFDEIKKYGFIYISCEFPCIHYMSYNAKYFINIYRIQINKGHLLFPENQKSKKIIKKKSISKNEEMWNIFKKKTMIFRKIRKISIFFVNFRKFRKLSIGFSIEIFGISKNSRIFSKIFKIWVIFHIFSLFEMDFLMVFQNFWFYGICRQVACSVDDGKSTGNVEKTTYFHWFSSHKKKNISISCGSSEKARLRRRRAQPYAFGADYG